MVLLKTPSLDREFIAQDFKLLSVDGKYYSLNDVRRKNGLVVAFICNHCPYVKAIAHKIAKEASELAAIDVGFIGINPNDTETYPEDSYENMVIFAEQHCFGFPYVIDITQKVAAQYDAICTPDLFGFDSNLRLRYRGRLDSAGKQDISDAKRELFAAMQAIALDGVFNDEQHPSIGCSIKWRDN